MAVEVLGSKELQKKLERLRTSTQNKLQRAAALAGLRVITKAIKAEVPSTWKEGKKAIGFSFARGKGKHLGHTFAKSGVGAGIRKKARGKQATKAKSRKGRKGVGIGVSNLHWFVMGTAERFTGSKRVGAHRRGKANQRVATGKTVRRTGRMTKNPIVARGFAKSQAAATKAIADNFRAGIEREAIKA